MRSMLHDYFQRLGSIARLSALKPTKPIATVEHILPRLAFAGITLGQGQAEIAYHDGSIHHVDLPTSDIDYFLTTWLQTTSSQQRHKLVAVGLPSAPAMRDLGSTLWLDHDVVPIYSQTGDHNASRLAGLAAQQFDHYGVARITIDQNQEVHDSPLITLPEQWKTCSEQERAWLEEMVERFDGKRLVFVSATPQGGGVALMRHAMMRLYRSLGADIHWHVLSENQAVFDVTKRKFHNVLQAVSNPDVVLTEADKALYLEWTAANAQVLQPAFEAADVIVIDDPQPAGLIPHIKQLSASKPVLYRSHIQIESKLVDTPGTPQYVTWQFLWQFIKEADAFIAHPVRAFVPKSVDQHSLVTMPATGDPLDGLNKPMHSDQLDYYRQLLARLLQEDGQTPLDYGRPYLTQVARFDPSKGIPDVLEAYLSLRAKMSQHHQPLPQLVIAGFGSVDDPDGTVVLELTRAMLQQERYSSVAEDVKVARLPHVDQLLNMIMRECKVYLQLSHKEGYEEKVSTALMMGRPVVVYKAGGIPLQVVDGKSGFVVEVGDTESVADHIYRLLTDDVLYQSMVQGALQHFNRECRTIPNATKWLYLASQMLDHGHIDQHDLLYREMFVTPSR